jgi:hypothetical protein
MTVDRALDLLNRKYVSQDARYLYRIEDVE